ncbi:MAG: 3-deoxy-7-phosphoheptulonate synthase class II [Spirochaetota bacterium]
MNDNWEKTNWNNFTIYQPTKWYDPDILHSITSQLSLLPALVFAGETRSLIKDLAEAGKGNAIVLQCGYCAETFKDCHGPTIHNLIRVILQMSIILTYITDKKIIKIGRIAGQYAKPRTNEYETINNIQLPAYRGDMINSIEPTLEARKHDPERILMAYYKAAATLNLIRAFTKGGYASLSQLLDWQKHYFNDFPIMKKYSKLAQDIIKSINFIQALGLDVNNPQFNEVNFYTSHEALVLEYEEAMTRIDTTTNTWYDTSAHMLWIGKRTLYPDSAHVEFLRGVNNPIGIKVGPDYSINDIDTIIQKLNPDNTEGKICVICRFGIDNIKKLHHLSKHIKNNNYNVVWICDPMHGNTKTTSENKKYRKFEDVVNEISLFWQILQSEGCIPAGVHLEITADNVTECTGGLRNITVENLHYNYTTACDPRLNAEQSVELAFLLSDIIKKIN